MRKGIHVSERNLYKCIQGCKRALPVVLGYLPIGFAYGVLAGKADISATNTILMSILVFAGSAQFIAVGLFASGAGPATIILTTFIVNLRHMLMAASLSPFLSKWSRLSQALFAYELTDETFALHSSAPRVLETCKPEVFSLNITCQVSWVVGTILGVVAANLIGDIKPLGLDFALAAMFIGLLVGQCQDKIRITAAVLGGSIATVLYLAGFQQSFVIMATLLSATLTLGIEQWIKQK